MADDMSIMEIPPDFLSRSGVWQNVENQLIPKPSSFFIETIEIILEFSLDSDGLFKPTHIGTVNEPRPTVYLLTNELIWPPYISATYLPPYRSMPGRSKIEIHLGEGSTIEAYVNKLEQELRSGENYEIRNRIKSGKKQIVITGPAGSNGIDDPSPEIEYFKKYDVSNDDRIGQTDFELKPYDPNEGQDDSSLMG